MRGRGAHRVGNVAVVSELEAEDDHARQHREVRHALCRAQGPVRSGREPLASLDLRVAECEGKSFNSKLSGSEVYCTNALLLLVKIRLCCKLHCQKV